MTARSTTRIFGTARRQVASIGQGTWKIEDSAAADVIAALRRGLDLGLTHIDTAEMYGSGASERIIGKAIEGRRDEVFLVSKVLPNHASKKGALAACEKSLAHLRTDRLDCFLLHWRGSVPINITSRRCRRVLGATAHFPAYLRMRPPDRRWPPKLVLRHL